MDIEMMSNTIVVPSPSSSTPLLNSHVPLTVFDRAALDLHFPILYAFKPPMPDNQAMKEALSSALSLFPHLAGRLTRDENGHPSILLNNAGIHLVETRVTSSLEDEILQLNSSSPDLLAKFYPPVDDVEELLLVQLNRFVCSGMVIGLSWHHRVADGQAIASFIHAWARLVRGLVVDPPPYHDRVAISIPRNPPHCEFDHQELKTEQHRGTMFSSSVVNLGVHFSPAFITRLKEHVMGTNSNSNSAERYSTFECMLVHLWKKITLVRRLRYDQLSQAAVGVNGRVRMRTAAPKEYFGNLVLWARPCLSVEELLQGSYTFVAKAIHEAVARMDDAYFRSFIDFGALAEAEKGGRMMSTVPEGVNSVSPNLEVDCWLRLEMDSVDFGSGKPCFFLPPLLRVEGLLILAPSCEEEGGVNAYVSLLHDQVEHFNQVSTCLDYALNHLKVESI